VKRLSTDESAPVRKVALEALAGVKPSAAIPIAVVGMGDPVGYVRSRAIRTLARLGTHARRSPVRHEIARHIVSMLADDEWEVRLAAKESLTSMGPEIWREVAAGLDSEDRFARNSAAEVLQNLGLLDRLIDDVGRGVEPSAEVVGVLDRAFREGGPGLVDAALARSNPEQFASIEQLMNRLQFVGVKVA
jgi:HEAT repeat protein